MPFSIHCSQLEGEGKSEIKQKEDKRSSAQNKHPYEHRKAEKPGKTNVKMIAYT